MKYQKTPKGYVRMWAIVLDIDPKRPSVCMYDRRRTAEQDRDTCEFIVPIDIPRAALRRPKRVS